MFLRQYPIWVPILLSGYSFWQLSHSSRASSSIVLEIMFQTDVIVIAPHQKKGNLTVASVGTILDDFRLLGILPGN